MSEVRILPTERLGRNFIPAQFLPAGKDEHYLRNEQSASHAGAWRHLRAEEIETLVKNANTCDDWDQFLVSDPFDPRTIKNSEFFGLVRVGRLERVILEHHDLRVPAGITDSLVISCDLGDNVAVHNVRYLAHFLVGHRVLLLNVNEMNTTNHAKFGNGIVKHGEPEDLRVWMDVMNEAGGRSVLPFDGMLAADAYLWAKYRDDASLIARLTEITQNQFDPRRGLYGMVGDQCVIKNSGILKDVNIGPHAYIKGANKLKNLTINSSRSEPTQIGEGVELVNGIVGLGCSVFYGCKAVRFVMGNNAKLKYGARLIHSYLGDNSTVSCCEILNNLVFPAHEQHHNNSFLTASLVLGQSNIAAGATIGSNHNSRANDGEIQAGRGFWPGLCVTLKHNCRFASFTLLVKADYPAELDIPLPFSLVSNDVARDCLQVLPAYWWLYNMYALARNTWKFQSRDQRKTKAQHVEFDSLAPDTAEEMFSGLELLERWTAKASLRASGQSPHGDDARLLALGRSLLTGPAKSVDNLEVLGENMEQSRRKTVILKPRQAYHAYREMLHHYALKHLLGFLQANPASAPSSMAAATAGLRKRSWINLGGQLVPAADVDALRDEIRRGKRTSWTDIHLVYDRLWETYQQEKQRHALATLLDLHRAERLTPELWNWSLDEAVRIQEYVCDQVLRCRQKDYEDPYRRITFRNPEEMRAVLGTAEGNSFVRQVRRETEAFKTMVEDIRRRGF